MSTQRVWKPIRIQGQSKPKSNTWKLSKLKAYWAVTILLKYSVEVVKAGVQYFTWSCWIIWSCSRLTQPNPRKFQKYDPNPSPCLGGGTISRLGGVTFPPLPFLPSPFLSSTLNSRRALYCMRLKCLFSVHTFENNRNYIRNQPVTGSTFRPRPPTSSWVLGLMKASARRGRMIGQYLKTDK